MIRSSLLAILLCLPAGPAAAGALEQALAEELARSTASLRQEGYPAPYFISLRASDARAVEQRCALGGRRYGGVNRQLLVTPDVRVGSYALDNHPLGPSDAFEGREIPESEDPLAIRHAIWLKLDEEYKQAAAGFLRKQALRVRRGKAEYDTDDLTREPALVREFPVAPVPDAAVEEAAALRLCEAASGGFRGMPELTGSQAEVTSQVVSNWLLDSEGTRVRYGQAWARLELHAQTLSADGMRLKASRSFYAPALAGLPDAAGAAAAARELASDLESLRQASSTSPFNAPALLDPSVGAAVLQALASRLSGEEQRNPDGGQTFREKLGKPVLPSFLSLDDDPTLKAAGGEPLLGNYDVDDQGVAAQKVTLVEGGVLRAFLLSRHPVLGFERSNGHGRAEPGKLPIGRASNLVLRSTATATQAQLLDLLRKEAQRRGKPYGLYIRKARAWSQQDKTGQHQAFRLLPTLVYLVDAKTGRQTLVRDLDMVGTPLDLMGRILAVGDDAQATHGIVEQTSGGLPVSTVCPTLLLQEVELQRSETKPERPYVLPPPTAAPAASVER